jgi:hypothetical protein
LHHYLKCFELGATNLVDPTGMTLYHYAFAGIFALCV